MKKVVMVLATCVMVLVLAATGANALTIGDSLYIGHAVPGAPANPADEVNYINSLLDLAPGAALAPCTLAASNSCDRVGSTIDVTGFPDAILPGNTQVDTSSGASIDVTGFTYLLGKYDAAGAGDYVWYVAGLGVVSIPNFAGTCGAGGCGLSHYALFNPVPDGGVTAGLLGLSILGLAYLRRRLA